MTGTLAVALAIAAVIVLVVFLAVMALGRGLTRRAAAGQTCGACGGSRVLWTPHRSVCPWCR